MDLPFQLRASLVAQSLPPPSTAFLASLVAARTPPLPLPSLLATARARLLACDLTTSTITDSALLSPLPTRLDVVETRLPCDVHVQVLDVDNLASSRWDQIEQLEATARGQETRGRQVVRVDASGDGSDAAPGPVAAAGPNATHRLVLQDRQGTRVYAVELRRDMRIGVGKTMIGEKMVLRAGTVVARGVVLLSPDTCLPLGGKIESWHNSWLEGRLARLKAAVGTQ